MCLEQVPESESPDTQKVQSDLKQLRDQESNQIVMIDYPILFKY